MKRIYLEANAFARAVERGVSGERLRRALAEAGYEPVTGLMTVYEFARGVRNPVHAAAICAQFRVLDELQPCLSQVSERVTRAEIAFANGGPKVVPFIVGAEMAGYRDLVHDYASGKVDPHLQWIVEQREQHVSGPLRGSLQQIVDRGRRLRVEVGKRAQELHGAAETLGYPPELILSEVLAPGLPRADYAAALARLEDLPHLRSRVRMIQLLCKIMLRDGVVPSGDRDSDGRHIADAAYCDAIASADRGLLQIQAPTINPSLEAVHWDSLGLG